MLRKVFGCLVLAAFLPLQVVFALPANPIVFVTQPPLPSDFATTNATFGNHRASLDSIPRGGDLYIRYSDGNLKNLTQSAGYGNSGMQGATSIAVRDPAVHWSGNKVLFSMAVGAPSQQYQVQTYYWQLYEISGLGANDTPVITKVANQPTNYNNVMPVYGSDDRIIFVSDRPVGGQSHLYPQRDEYESTATNTGLWSLDVSSGDLFQLDHSPSGDFTPIIDSFGRVIFTRWDHLQRDQQNRCSQASFEAFNYSDESEQSIELDDDSEVFPEARAECDNGKQSTVDRHTFNLFMPWQVNEDGTELETINHIGRHELQGYIGKSFNDDSNVVEYYQQYNRTNAFPINNFFQLQEDPTQAGRYVGIDAPEFGTHASGQIISVALPPETHPDQVSIEYLTHRDTASTDDTPSANHIGLSRDPMPLSDGSLIAVHGNATAQDSNIGSSTAPQSKYSFRIKTYSKVGSYFTPQSALTSGITKTISFWSPDQLVSYSNVTMWELQPREVHSRTRPSKLSPTLGEPEQNMFEAAGVNVEDFQDYLRSNELALVVSRNLTTRDALDKQQPFNLKVSGSSTQTVGTGGKVYDISFIQFFQGDLIRGYGDSAGRRVLATVMHGISSNPPLASAPEGSVKIGTDGSMAAFVPARRALTYQLTDDDGSAVVRERLWLTFQPGEIRVCASCHGVNSKDQAGQSAPTNNPLALKELLEYWRSAPQDTPTFSLSVGGKSKLRAGKKFIFKITGNALSAGGSISIALKVGSKNCGILKSVTLNDAAQYTKMIKAPAVSKRFQLKFKLLRSGESKATAQTTIVPGGASSLDTAAGVCRQFKKLLK